MIEKGSAYGHRSSKSDSFYTPSSMTEQFIEKSKKYKLIDLQDSSILEPACGELAIVNVLKKHCNPEKLRWSDKNMGDDFLQSSRKVDYIITNPPFSLVNQFILHSKRIAQNGFAFLFKTDFLSGLKRYKLIYEGDQNLYSYKFNKSKDLIRVYNKLGIFSHYLDEDNKLKDYFDVIEGDPYGLKFIFEFVRKPDLRCEIREDGKYTPAIEAYSWLYWEKGYQGRPRLDWIDNQKYILKKADK